MKSKFQHFRRPDSKEFEDLWRDATIVLDANVLLNAYRYSDKTRRELFALLRRLGDRLWVPYQAALEFHLRRPAVMLERRAVFAELRQSIEQSASSLKDRLSTLYRDAAINPESLMKEVQEAQERLVGDLAAREGKETVEPTSSPKDDPIWRAILELFDGRTGDPYDPETYAKLCKEGEERFAQGKPPGFADKAKGGLDQFGDYIIWRQMLDHAGTTKESMLFVTDDRKEDWWFKVKEKTIGPRPELVAEMRAEAGVAFYMYQPVQFMTHAAEQVKARVSQAALGEVRDLAPRLVMRPDSLREEVIRPPYWREDMLRRRMSRAFEELAARRRELDLLDELLVSETSGATREFLEARRGTLLLELQRLDDQLRALDRQLTSLARNVHEERSVARQGDRSLWQWERSEAGQVEGEPDTLGEAPE